MNHSPSLPAEQTVHFGPYRVHPQQHLVLEAGQPLRLGRRAVEILLVLLEHAGQVVSKQQLIARVWPKSIVEDTNLRVHVAALRKALGDGQAGQRYIITVAQRGYSFVAPVSLEPLEPPVQMPHPSLARNLPLRHTRMIGRHALLESLVAQLPRKRFITLVGTGGIGKTTVALRVAERLIGHYRDGTYLLDLAPLNDPAMIAPNLAALLDLPLQDGDPLDAIARQLKERRLLLVIDNCEHLIDAVAQLSETLLRGAPHLHILATSREGLRAEGEHVQHLDALAFPPREMPVEGYPALEYPALQLFAERAMASRDDFELTDREVPWVAEICQRLDGIPLAIELAAAQISRFTVQELHQQLLASSALLHNSADAEPRQQTLRATLDWSFALLTSCEQTCLRRLAVFMGSFNLTSAAAVIVGQQVAPEQVLVSVSQLVAKSLLNVEIGDEEVRYRLLDTTRSYALEKLTDAVELSASRERHAERCLTLMKQAEDDWQTTPTHLWIARYAAYRDDIRAALDWGLGPQGARAVAIRLTARTLPLWQELSLLKEHGLYVSKALELLRASPMPCPKLTLALELAHGSYSYHTEGGTPATIHAFVIARQLAQQNQDLAGELRAVSGHMAVNLSCGNYGLALEQSQDFDRLGTRGDPTLSLSAQRLRVLALHFAGDQGAARRDAEQVIQRMAQSGHLSRFTHGFGVQYDQSVASLTILARILWLQGFPEKAQRTADLALQIALQIDHGTSICYTLALAGCVIACYNGDHATARDRLDLLQYQTKKHFVMFFHDWARYYVRAFDNEPLETESASARLVQDIVATLRAGSVSTAQLERAHSGAAGWCSAELLRADAQTLLARNDPALEDRAEAQLQTALAVAHRDHALAWELRSATSLARLWQRRGQGRAALELLGPVYRRFTEGFDTPDLLEADALLQDLSGRCGS
ncbi:MULTISPECIES: ATP-binding protein [Pseudomonas]|uniref:ATP-binding protein n=1 Tax=Pseudomonas TaxID=286 RepID=UPI001BEA6C52|nr:MULTISPECIES: winged helix-turn-helix domain-containing protein [Pseudomonas]MBT2337735.1 helix-turn-helix transcriptional regulator [Pseudomonas fluorescens]MCD4528044.1 helix-turn-helix transcriptional regulator [Pseudomonas sp. C3-2018]